MTTDNTMYQIYKKSKDTADRISELPEDILHDILSCLKPEEAARTSVLSKTWQSIGTRNPFLVFRYDPKRLQQSRRGQRGRQGRRNTTDHEENTKRFMDYVESRVRSFPQHESILKFHLIIENHFNHDRDSPRIDSWLEQVMDKGIKYLHLCLWSLWTTSLYCYSLPRRVLNSSTLVELVLYYCKLDAARGEILLPNLLKLQVGYLELDENLIKHLISGCPLLQLLYIHCSLRLANLRVTGLPSLQDVKLFSCRHLANVEILSGNLQNFTYVGEQPLQCDFTLPPTLKRLELMNVDVNPQWLRQQVSKCNELSLGYMSGIEDIEFSSPNLQKLDILYCQGMAKIDCPNLDSLSFFWNSLPFHSTLDNFKLRNMHLRFCFENVRQYDFWLEKIEGFFKYFSSNKELIKLAIFRDGHEDVIILDGLTELALPILCDNKELMPKYQVQISSVQNSKDLKYLMGILYFPTVFKTLHVTSAHGNHNFSEMLYEMLSKAKAEGRRCNELERLTWWPRNICNVQKISRDISEIHSHRVPAALRSFKSGPYHITRIELQWRNEAAWRLWQNPI